MPNRSEHFASSVTMRYSKNIAEMIVTKEKNDVFCIMFTINSTLA